jgi:hypothetical protein
MNCLLLISPARAWGFQPILSGKLPTQTQLVISEFFISNFKSKNGKSQISNGINLWGRLAVPTPVCIAFLRKMRYDWG